VQQEEAAYPRRSGHRHVGLYFSNNQPSTFRAVGFFKEIPSGGGLLIPTKYAIKYMSVCRMRLARCSANTGAVRLARCYHYETPRNVGSLDKNDANVGTGLVGAPACGDVMKLQLKVGADGRIKEAVFKARGAS